VSETFDVRTAGSGTNRSISICACQRPLKIAISAGIQSAIYLAALASIGFGQTAALYYFFLPAILAQPLLRAILIAEHTGCSTDENGLTNTRTTLTGYSVRLLMWNMPFHTEHHLYPSIPFISGCLKRTSRFEKKLTHLVTQLRCGQSHELSRGLGAEHARGELG